MAWNDPPSFDYQQISNTGRKFKHRYVVSDTSKLGQVAQYQQPTLPSIQSQQAYNQVDRNQFSGVQYQQLNINDTMNTVDLGKNDYHNIANGSHQDRIMFPPAPPASQSYLPQQSGQQDQSYQQQQYHHHLQQPHSQLQQQQQQPEFRK